MSLGGRAEVARLRRVVAQIEAGGISARRAASPAGACARSGPRRRPGRRRLARDRPGRARRRGRRRWASRLRSRRASSSRRPSAALFDRRRFQEREAGALYGPGLVAHGLPLSRLVFVRAPDAEAAFWAMEEALKCGAPAAVVGEIWSLKGYSLAASRRLLLAARKGRRAGAARAGERLWPGGQAFERGRDAVRDRRRAERAASRGGGARSARPLRLRGAARQGAPDPAARGAGRGGRHGPRGQARMAKRGENF